MEWLTTENGKYRIECLSAATFPGAEEVMRHAFYAEESSCIGSEVDKNPECIEELMLMCGYVALDGASLVAVEVATGEVAAVALNKLLVSDASGELSFETLEKICQHPSSRSLCNFATSVDRYNFFEGYGIDCTMEIMFLATLKAHRKQGLGELLCKASIDLARKLKDGPVARFTFEDLGPKYLDYRMYLDNREVINTYPKACIGVWTGAATQKLGKKLNFTVHATISYDEFNFEGKTFSERISTKNPVCEVAGLKLY